MATSESKLSTCKRILTLACEVSLAPPISQGHTVLRRVSSSWLSVSLDCILSNSPLRLSMVSISASVACGFIMLLNISTLLFRM